CKLFPLVDQIYQGS
ncbi:unnamed protein product, partial [Arctia plantaginis]